MKRNELSFARTQKSSEECEKKGDSSENRLNVRRSERRNVGRMERTPYTPGNLHEYQKKGDKKFAICKCMKRKNVNESVG
jgi:hypothetical protein